MYAKKLLGLTLAFCMLSSFFVPAVSADVAQDDYVFEPTMSYELSVTPDERLAIHDEVDKLSMDYRGDPSAALLEVLDPAQNSTFSDHFIELPFDLSKVMWIVTANNLGNIPRALRDRMEIIQLSSYTEIEKREIAKRYLVARQREQNGLKAKDIHFGAGVIDKIIENYTREAGVRELCSKCTSA